MSQQDVELVRSLFDGMVNADKEALLLTLRNGKLLRYREFYDADAARRAAGG